ncbi:hypothetical protein [Rhodococcus sp. BS-15]|uniref:hypothetical protein n=1 Tax=Rhodococcus sp. BS-15 TaxID=1304954 RepID=UPI000AE57498|nr:hypothetical protein [Rhodococcus sp. BS-15]
MADAFWKNVDASLDRIGTATTVDEVIDSLNEHFEKSSGDAFFGGSGGDRQLYEALIDAGWTWSDAVYHFAAKDKAGKVLTYVEGDVYRGDQKPS